MTTSELLKEQSLLIQQLQAERDDAIARADGLQWQLNQSREISAAAREEYNVEFAARLAAEADTSDLGHKYTDLAGVAWRLRERAQAAEAALAAVPIAELRRIVEMHNANQWSSIEGPPLWEKVESWLEKPR